MRFCAGLVSVTCLSLRSREGDGCRIRVPCPPTPLIKSRSRSLDTNSPSCGECCASQCNRRGGYLAVGGCQRELRVRSALNRTVVHGPGGRSTRRPDRPWPCPRPSTLSSVRSPLAACPSSLPDLPPEQIAHAHGPPTMQNVTCAIQLIVEIVQACAPLPESI